MFDKVHNLEQIALGSLCGCVGVSCDRWMRCKEHVGLKELKKLDALIGILV